ncbi:MAG: PIN domain nuclease [Dehalococcoidia bacterium]|nr:PIN domain nuclease [Dehalococcoidia bacterium]
MKGRDPDRSGTSTFLLTCSGLLAGLVAGVLLYPPLSAIPGRNSWVIPIFVSLGLGALGAGLALWKRRGLQETLPFLRGIAGHDSHAIVVDTSAIIDGRIADLATSGFISGTFFIPSFILDELRHIADSTDPLRRNRGRRGLDVLGRLNNKESRVPIEIIDVPYENGVDVDARLVLFAKQMSAPLLTTDFNLNRAAELHGVKVLNVNELANALRQVVMPGEDLTLRVVQEGRELGQGIGFLDDGTMVVIEGGRRFLNTQLDVTVSRVLQTATGRIIFAQPRGAT